MVIGLTFLICLGIVIWRFKKGKGGHSHSFARNTFSDPSRKDHEGDSKYFGVPVFSYSTLEEATSNFDPSQELGDGGFGTVYYGKKPHKSSHDISNHIWKSIRQSFALLY